LREKFGTGAEFNARIREAGAFIWRSYQEQLAQAGPTPVFESAGVDDRPLLELLEKQHSIAFIHVHVSRELCVERVVSRPAGRNINRTTDRERVGRYYDVWHSKVFRRTGSHSRWPATTRQPPVEQSVSYSVVRRNSFRLEPRST
jgi:hypothetical protein